MLPLVSGMREQRGHDVVRLVLGLFNDRAHRVGGAASGPGEVHPGRPARGDDLRPGRGAGLLSFGERAVDGGDRGVLSGVLTGLDGRLLRDLGTGTPLSFSARAKVSMSSSMTFGRPPWLPLAAAVTWPSRVFSRM
ncbi:hypothetical protein AB0H88_41890 [Nonomuraea sp. NPDC050680]|uniref:hypothetical protein n=1 Tax=Nonomuraea sp. NPDC050680 TaxID=3154630 RepID=UPI0033D0D24A